jgi:hypothetical protein
MTAPPAEPFEETHAPARQRVGFFVADSGGLCLWASVELLDIVMLDTTDLVGQFWFRILSEEDRKEAIPLWESTIPDARSFSFATAAGGKGKTRLFVESEFVPAQRSRPAYCVGVVIETAGESKAEDRYERLQDAIAKADQAERDRFDLIASLNVADSTINQLQSDLKRATEKNQELLKRIEELGANITRTEGELAQTYSAKFGLESQIVVLQASHGHIASDQLAQENAQAPRQPQGKR